MTIKTTKNNPELYNFMQSFFEAYYSERDPFKVLDMMSDQVIVVGLVGKELAFNKDEFMAFMSQQMHDIPYPLEYKVSEYFAQECATGVYTIFAKIGVKVNTEGWNKVKYQIRLSLTVLKVGASYKISLAHYSEVAGLNDIYIPSIDRVNYQDSEKEAQIELGRMISQLVPGGIVSCFVEEGFPISIANEQFVQILGYHSFDEYYRAIDGKYLNSIHPDDVSKYRYNVEFAISTAKKCECEYRLRTKNNEYIWIHDIARKAMADNGDEVVLSALVDISEQIERRQRLELESGIDDLTGIYNRKGARQQIEKYMTEQSRWIFFLADLDNFKLVNDIYGHKQGDKILRYIAEQLNQYFGQIGTVCRLGGDEFTLFLTQYDNVDDVLKLMLEVAERYGALLSEICPKANSSLSIGGVYGYGFEDFGKIYDQADRNLYKIKNSQKGCLNVSSINEIDLNC